MQPTCLALAALSVLTLCAASADAGTLKQKAVRLNSTTAAGTPSEYGGNNPSTSKNGRYVAFSTISPSLVAGMAPGGMAQIVRKDTKTGKLLVVSVNAQGDLADEACSNPVLSSNGQRIAYLSSAYNLEGDSGGGSQVIWKNLVTGEQRRLSESLAGSAAIDDCHELRISDDGNRVVFSSKAQNLPGAVISKRSAYVYDLGSATLERVTFGAQDVNPADDCYASGISGDGRYVCFVTNAQNMGFPGGTTRISNSGRRVLVDRAGTNPDLAADSYYWVAITDRESGKNKLFSLSGQSVGEFDDLLYTSLPRSGKRIVFVSNSPLLGPSVPATGQVYTAKCGKL